MHNGRPTKMQVLQSLVQETGLDRATIKNLLKQGWQYQPSSNGVVMAFVKARAKRLDG